MRGLVRAGVNHKFIEIVDSIVSLPVLFSLVLIGYFYCMVYISVHRQKLNDIRGIRTQARQTMERSIADTTAIIVTFALRISYLPSLVVILAGTKMPFLI